MVVTFLAANNKKPKTVYLKPKDTKKDKDANQENNNSTEEDNNKSPSAPSPAAPPQLRPDEDAMRSELRSLRQTAVSLTVGEKEGASALIKEWLEDNPNKSDEEEEDAGE